MLQVSLLSYAVGGAFLSLGYLDLYYGLVATMILTRDAVAKVMGGYDKTRDFYRLFVAPGMGHCSGGPGPNTFDALTALEQWVEHGVAPDTLIATHSTGGTVDRTRPLCPYPQVAQYKGVGSTNDAANFTCKAPQSTAN